MAFARLMATPFGRLLRVVVGVALVFCGLQVVGGGWGIVLALLGTTAVLAGALNLCLIAKLIGAPFRGRDALKS